MTNEKNGNLSDFMHYLARKYSDGDRLPALTVLSQELGISIATLREQLEVARSLGLVEVKPKLGIRRQQYQFKTAVLNSLSYAACIDANFYFDAFADLRNHIEAAYWQQAVSLLLDEDHIRLRELVSQALMKLQGNPIQIPHNEHRELHLIIYRRLNNPFVTGILEAYWEAYEANGLSTYTDIRYLQTVWDYHRRMVESICAGDYANGYHLLIEHTNLLHQRVTPNIRSVAARPEFE